jgi:hypothetical protein
MENKKLILGGLIGGVAFFFLGFLLYGLMLKNFFAAQVTVTGLYKEIPDFLTLAIGNLSMAFLLAYILLRTNNTSSGDGAKTGFMVGLLSTIGFDFILFATTGGMTMTGIIADIAVVAIMSAIVGAIQMMVMGTARKTMPA